MNIKVASFLVALTILLAGVAGFVLSKFYDRYELAAREIGQNLAYDADTANAIKHATAAADMFTILRPLIGEARAEEAVIRLGVLNEYIERVIYPDGSLDTPREIMKDLHNNYVGITAVKIAGAGNASKIILSFADNKTLIVNRIYNPFFKDKEPKTDVVAFGRHWFNEERENIDRRIEKKWKRSREFRAIRSIEISSLTKKKPVLVE